jgi:hypothetical protein
MQDGPPDAVAVAAWHLALSNLLGQEVSHDLLGLWLFPERGGVMLLAPQELGRDQVPIQEPDRFLPHHQLYELEQRIRQAGYGSVVAVPIRGRQRDLGLAIFARLEAGRYGADQAMRLLTMMSRVVPTFAQLAESPPLALAAGPAVYVTRQNAAEDVAKAAAEGRSPAEVLRLASGVLQGLVPHERIEVAVPGVAAGTWALLSGPPEGRRWSDSTSAVSQHVNGLVARADEDGTLIVGDLRAVGLSWPAYRETRALQRIHAVLGVRLTVAGGDDAWLLLGGAAPDLYREIDRELLIAVAPVVALRVHGLRMALEAEVSRIQAANQMAGHSRAARIASALAGTPDWADAIRSFVQDVRDSLGYSEVRWILRTGEAEYAVQTAADPRPDAWHPLLPFDAVELAALFHGATPFLVRGNRGADLLVPLRLGGSVIGALELKGGSPGAAGHPVTTAQLFADLIAPHLELARRNSRTGGWSEKQVG